MSKRDKCIYTREQRPWCHNHAQFIQSLNLTCNACVNKQTTKGETGTTPRASVASSVVTRDTVSVRLLHPSLLIRGGDIYLFYIHSVFMPSVCALEAWSFHITLVYAEYWTRTGFQVFNESRENTHSQQWMWKQPRSVRLGTYIILPPRFKLVGEVRTCLRVSLAEQVLTQFLCCGLASPEHDLEYTEAPSHSCKRSRIKMQRCKSSSPTSKDGKTEAEDIQHLSQWIYRKLNLVSLSLFPTNSKSGSVSKPLIHRDRWENVLVFPHSVCDVWPEFISKSKPHLVIVWLERRFSLCAFVMESGCKSEIVS